ncbi:hypothetical protein V8D89_007185 [Ganoderma adspersum]
MSTNWVQEELDASPGSFNYEGVRVYPSSEPSRSLSGLLSESDSKLGLDPVMQSMPPPGGHAGGVELTADQLSVVQSAILGLTLAQRDLVRHRMDAVEGVAPHVEDTSDRKGPDPRNWGGVADMDPEELDVEFQPPIPMEDPDVTALCDEVSLLREQITLLSMMQRAGSRPSQAPEAQPPPPAQALPSFGGPSISTASVQPTGLPRSYSISGPSQYGTETVSHTMMPAVQIDPTSMLGKLLSHSAAIPALSAAGRGGGGGGGDLSASTSAAQCAGQLRVLVLKPREPEKYKSNASVQAFQKFVQEATAYCIGYTIEEGTQVFRISSFLEGKAWEYYQFYSNDKEEFNEPELAKFLSGLFNYCFPLDFKQRMRDKLQSAQQGNRSVKEFVHELNSLYIMIGSVPEPLRVQKLWYDLERWIQSHLWWAALTPNTASWAEVQYTAELAERAKDAGDRATCRSTRDSSHQGGSQPKTSGPTVRSGNRTSGASVASESKNTSRTFERKGTSSNRPGPRSDKPTGSSSKPTQKPSANNGSGQRKPTGNDTCFECGQAGHFRRNCPQLNKVQLNTKGKPPGVTNFNVDIDFMHAEELRELAESTAWSDQLELNYTKLALFSDEGSSGPPSLQSVSNSSSEALECVLSFEPSPLERSSSFAGLGLEPSEHDFLSDVGTTFDGDEDPFSQYPSLVREWYEQQAHVLALSFDEHSSSVSECSADTTDECNVPPPLDAEEWFLLDSGGPVSLDVSNLVDGVDELLGSLWLPEVRPRSTIRQHLGFLWQAVPEATPEDALAEGLTAALQAVCPVLDGTAQSLGLADSGQHFMCVQHPGFIEIQDHYLSFSLLVPDHVVEHPLLDLEQWYARQVRDALAPCFDPEDLTDELSVLFRSNNLWETEERTAPLELPTQRTASQPVDLYAAQAESMLRMLGPYFWDPTHNTNIEFWVEPLPDGDYRVWGAGLDDPPLLR